MTAGIASVRRWLGWLIGLVSFALVAIVISAMQSRSTATPPALIVVQRPTATLTVTPPPTPTPTLSPTATPQPTPTKTQVPPTPMPTILVTPVPMMPPVSDGVNRSVDVPILMYHYISAPPSPNDRIRVGLSVPPDRFDAQMKLLAENGFHTIRLFDLYETLANGRALPDKPVIITFDDGYIDNYENAFPILQKYGMTATFFVLAGRADAGDPAYMSWDMITAISDAGMDVQLHSKAHVDLRNRSFEYLVFQIIGGRQSIEGHTGKPVIFMAYPSGKYDDAVLRFLKGNNYWAALTTAYGRSHALKDALTWTRVRIAGQLSLNGFARLLGIK